MCAETHVLSYVCTTYKHTNEQICERPGDLLCCDTCNLAFHMACLGRIDDEVPDDFRWVACNVSCSFLSLKYALL